MAELTRWRWRAVFSSTLSSPRDRSLPSSSSTKGFSLWPQGRSKISQSVSNATRTGLPYIGRLCFQGGDSPLRRPAIFRRTDLRAMPVLRQYSSRSALFPLFRALRYRPKRAFRYCSRDRMSILCMSPYPLWDLGNILYDSTGLPSVTYYVSQCAGLTSND